MGITVFGSFVFLGHLNLPDAVVVDFNGMDSFAVNLYNLVDEDFINESPNHFTTQFFYFGIISDDGQEMFCIQGFFQQRLKFFCPSYASMDK